MSEGTITVRDTENQKQDVAGLRRDAEHANGSISPIFDKEKEQKRLQEVQLIGQIGNQAADIARTQGEINGLNAGKKALAKEGIPEPDVNASDEEKARYQTQLRNSAAYKTEQAKYGKGSDIQRGIQAAVGALQGLAGGDIGAALAGASAPELAYIIGHKAGLSEDDIAAKAIAHAILGGVVAAMQGNNAAAGAAGSAAGELAANAILKTMYPGKRVSELDESDRQLVSNLATIASGLAGNLAGGDSKSTTTGAQSGKNSVENNALSKDKPNIFDISPMLKIGVEDADGELLKGGGGIANGRPSHKQSEKDVGKDLGAGWKEQVSYKDGKEVPYGTKGSTRPDWCNGSTCSIEVKNYNIATNQSGLINNVAKQAIDRQANLPSGIKQEIVIDTRGQRITATQEDFIVRGIVQKSNGIIKPTDIQFKRDLK